MTVSFQLTMPNVGSWNGRWTGAGTQYFVIRKYRAKEANRIIACILNGENARRFYYDFGDGWGANVTAEIIDAKEANKRRKISAGFCGYEWMVDSIIKNGKIIFEKEEVL